MSWWLALCNANVSWECQFLFEQMALAIYPWHLKYLPTEVFWGAKHATLSLLSHLCTSGSERGEQMWVASFQCKHVHKLVESFKWGKWLGLLLAADAAVPLAWETLKSEKKVRNVPLVKPCTHTDRTFSSKMTFFHFFVVATFTGG